MSTTRGGHDKDSWRRKRAGKKKYEMAIRSSFPGSRSKYFEVFGSWGQFVLNLVGKRGD